MRLQTEFVVCLAQGVMMLRAKVLVCQFLAPTVHQMRTVLAVMIMTGPWWKAGAGLLPEAFVGDERKWHKISGLPPEKTALVAAAGLDLVIRQTHLLPSAKTMAEKTITLRVGIMRRLKDVLGSFRILKKVTWIKLSKCVF